MIAACTGWPPMWRTWKSPGTWKWSGISRGNCEKSGKLSSCLKYNGWITERCSLQMMLQWYNCNKTHSCYSVLNYIQNLYFGCFIVWKLSELGNFVTYWWNDRRICVCIGNVTGAIDIASATWKSWAEVGNLMWSGGWRPCVQHFNMTVSLAVSNRIPLLSDFVGGNRLGCFC